MLPNGRMAERSKALAIFGAEFFIASQVRILLLPPNAVMRYSV